MMMIRQTQTIKNHSGDIVAKLYLDADGNIHPDSWVNDLSSMKRDGTKDIEVGDIIEINECSGEWVVSDVEEDDHLFTVVNISGDLPVKDEVTYENIRVVVQKRGKV